MRGVHVHVYVYNNLNLNLIWNKIVLFCLVVKCQVTV